MSDSIDCHIRVKGHLIGQWSGWFGGLAVQNLPGEQALLTGQVPDQAALFGVLARIRDLGMRVIALNCIEKGAVSPDLRNDGQNNEDRM